MLHPDVHCRRGAQRVQEVGKIHRASVFGYKLSANLTESGMMLHRFPASSLSPLLKPPINLKITGFSPWSPSLSSSQPLSLPWPLPHPPTDLSSARLTARASAPPLPPTTGLAMRSTLPRASSAASHGSILRALLATRPATKTTATLRALRVRRASTARPTE